MLGTLLNRRKGVEFYESVFLQTIVVLIETFNVNILLPKVDILHACSYHLLQVEDIVLRVMFVFLFPETDVLVEVKEYYFTFHKEF